MALNPSLLKIPTPMSQGSAGSVRFHSALFCFANFRRLSICSVKVCILLWHAFSCPHPFKKLFSSRQLHTLIEGIKRWLLIIWRTRRKAYLRLCFPKYLFQRLHFHSGFNPNVTLRINHYVYFMWSFQNAIKQIVFNGCSSNEKYLR